jgi:hypothetical protein
MHNFLKVFVLSIYFITSIANASPQPEPPAILLPGLIQTQTNLAQQVGANTAPSQALETQMVEFKAETNANFAITDAQIEKRHNDTSTQISELRQKMDSRFDDIVKLLNSTLINHEERISKLEEHWTIGLEGRILNWGTLATFGGIAGTLKAATTWTLPDPLQNALVLVNGLALGAISWHIIGPAFPQFLAFDAETGTILASIMAAYHLMQHKAYIFAPSSDETKP